jgi:hypothetical protein
LVLALPDTYQNKWEIISEFIAIPIGIIGTIYIFQKNEGKNGIYFLQRYLSIGWVISIRLLLMCVLPVMIIISIVKSAVGYRINSYMWYDAMFWAAFAFFWYLRVGFHVGEVANQKNTEQ